ncbi:MAG: SseB family protein [Rhodobacteraceae bacterium]|nr:SseB family protein [Paracoccaceae bacterium]
MTETALDTAHAAMEAAGDDAARLRFFERMADAELLLLLREEPQGEDITPQIFETGEGTFALVFDREDRLSEFVGAEAAHAALAGRTLIAMLSGQGIGLGLNLGVAPSSILIPAEAVDWLAGTLAEAPREIEARPTEFAAPGALPQALIEALDAKLPSAMGLARFAYLASATYEDGARGHILAFIDAAPGAEPALARAAGEALIFSGLEAGEMDVAFFAASDPLSAKLARVALRFDLPQPPELVKPQAPGSDPERPPRLK